MQEYMYSGLTFAGENEGETITIDMDDRVRLLLKVDDTEVQLFGEYRGHSEDGFIIDTTWNWQLWEHVNEGFHKIKEPTMVIPWNHIDTVQKIEGGN